jgi:hypothetical protein
MAMDQNVTYFIEISWDVYIANLSNSKGFQQTGYSNGGNLYMFPYLFPIGFQNRFD